QQSIEQAPQGIHGRRTRRGGTAEAVGGQEYGHPYREHKRAADRPQTEGGAGTEVPQGREEDVEKEARDEQLAEKFGARKHERAKKVGYGAGCWGSGGILGEQIRAD